MTGEPSGHGALEAATPVGPERRRSSSSWSLRDPRQAPLVVTERAVGSHAAVICPARAATERKSTPTMTAAKNPGVRRKDVVLVAATELFRSHGFHAVGIDDIGAAAGISGPGVYRHFPNKHSLLVAMFDRVADELLEGADRILGSSTDERAALCSLVEFHTDFALTERSIIAVYYQEQRNLPDQDRRRIRHRQRRYLDHWVKLLTHLEPALSDPEALAVVHAAIGVITSTTLYESRLDRDRLRVLLVERARLVLFGGPA